jgi:hypothetical protein
MNEEIRGHTGVHREGMRSRVRTTRSTPVRVAAPLLGRAVRRYYGSIPMKNRRLRIVTFPLAILVSLAAWGSVVYFAMHYLKK